MSEPNDKAPAPPAHDLVLVHGRTDDGEGLRAIRSRPDRLELAELRPLREGRPIGEHEVVALHRRAESPVLWDVEVQYDPKAPATGHEGPARVTSRRYRENWDAIFARPDPTLPTEPPTDPSKLN